MCRTRRTKRPRWSALGRLPHRDPVHSGVLLPVSPNDNGVGAHSFCVQRVAVHRRRGLKTTRGSRRQSREASRSCRMSRMARQQTKSKDKCVSDKKNSLQPRWNFFLSRIYVWGFNERTLLGAEVIPLLFCFVSLRRVYDCKHLNFLLHFFHNSFIN